MFYTAVNFGFSRWAEDLIIYSTSEFGYVVLSDAYRYVRRKVLHCNLKLQHRAMFASNMLQVVLNLLTTLDKQCKRTQLIDRLLTELLQLFLLSST